MADTRPEDHSNGGVVSTWASICGPEVVIYDAGYADTVPDDGFLDVAVSCLDARVRIIAEAEGESGLALDLDGCRELRRRLDEAITRMETA